MAQVARTRDMASSSVSQEDIDNDISVSASNRRSRVRAARAHKITPPSRFGESGTVGDDEGGDTSVGTGDAACFSPEHDASPKAMSRTKDKRLRPNHLSKGKAQRDRRKLREKRRSTGVVHLPSTESTGGSTEEGGDPASLTAAETKKNTLHNEVVDTCQKEHRTRGAVHRRAKSQSDLDADDEDNASLHQSDSVNSLVQNVSRSSLSTNGRPANENIEDMLERLRKENSHLHNLLEEKDQQMATLELQVATLHMEVLTLSSERDRLKQENSVLISSLQDK